MATLFLLMYLVRKAIIFLICVISPFTAAGENTVVLSSRLWSQPVEQEFIVNQILKPFEEANNCQVIFQLVENDWELLTQVTEQVEAGQVTTDVVLVYVDGMREWVEKGSVVLLIETEKTQWEVEAETSGFLHILVGEGKKAEVGKVVGVLAETKKELREVQRKLSGESRSRHIRARPPSSSHASRSGASFGSRPVRGITATRSEASAGISGVSAKLSVSVCRLSDSIFS